MVAFIDRFDCSYMVGNWLYELFVCLLTDENGLLTADNEYPNVLFLMHKWFMTSEELAEAFVDLYPFDVCY